MMFKSPREAIQPDSIPATATRSKRARGPLVTLLSALMTLGLVVGVIGAMIVQYGMSQYRAPGPLKEDRTVVIARGSGMGDIAQTLYRNGVIDSPFLFTTAVRAIGAASDLKAGEYVFQAAISPEKAIEKLIEGRAIQHAVTIPEGWTSQMIVARLLEDDVLTGDIKVVPPEGALLPETYVFERGTTREQILKQMRDAQTRVLREIWERRSPEIAVTTPEELVTLASIVEKETGKADERPRVAGVFDNRLKKRMKLQSDPTIIYGIVGGKGRLDRPILRSDITAPTPYNTYVIPGLPPGPIANPGRASLEAVANPMKTDELFFVADGTGGHAFAATLEDHNRNVARWREVERRMREEAERSAAGNVEGAGTPREAAPSDQGAAVETPAGEAAPVTTESVDPDLPIPPPRPGSPADETAGDAPRDGAAADAGATVPAGEGAQGFADPVENSRMDPLLKRGFDLNSPQVVPATP